MPEIALLGDSIFDNAAYVRGGPDVVTQLRAELPRGWDATLCAVDGAVIDGVRMQLRRIPASATHVVLSAGGNDALGHSDLLGRPARSSAEVLGWFADAVEAFEARYRRLVAELGQLGRPLTVCTIYDGNLGAPTQRLATTALALFDDAIRRAVVDGARTPEHEAPGP